VGIRLSLNLLSFHVLHRVVNRALAEAETGEFGAEPVNLSRGMVNIRPETIMRLLWGGAGIALTGLIAMVSATVSVTNQLNQVKQSIADATTSVNAKTDELARKIDNRTSDRWTLSMEREEMNRLQRANPMFIPADVDEIWNRIRPWDSSK